MNIIVCIKAVPTTIRPPAAKSDGSGIISEGDYFINESDDYALEQALLLKKRLGGKVTVLTIGNMKSQNMMHVSLAKGADDAIRVDADEFDPNTVSLLLARALASISYDLIFAGAESSDRMSSQVGPSTAGRLGIPCVYAVTKVSIERAEGPVTVTRELGGGRCQILEVEIPALLCVQSGIVPLTYAPLVKLIHARRKGIPSIACTALNLNEEELTRRRSARIIDVKPVEKNSSTQWLSGNPQQLARQIIDNVKKSL